MQLAEAGPQRFYEAERDGYGPWSQLAVLSADKEPVELSADKEPIERGMWWHVSFVGGVGLLWFTMR